MMTLLNVSLKRSAARCGSVAARLSREGASFLLDERGSYRTNSWILEHVGYRTSES